MRCAYCTLRVADLFTAPVLLDRARVPMCWIAKQAFEPKKRAKFTSAFVGRNKQRALRRTQVNPLLRHDDRFPTGPYDCIAKLINWWGTVLD
jgi:hypothetical protein